MKHIFVHHSRNTRSFKRHFQCDGWEYIGTAIDEADFIRQVSDWEEVFEEDNGELRDSQCNVIYYPDFPGEVDCYDYYYKLVAIDEMNDNQKIAMGVI